MSTTHRRTTLLPLLFATLTIGLVPSTASADEVDTGARVRGPGTRP